MGDFRLTHCFSAMDLYETYNCKEKLKGYRKLARKYGGDRLQTIATSMFVYCFYLVFLDIVENNANFTLPLKRGIKAQFYTKSVVGEELERLMKSEAFSEQDVIGNNFVGYRLEFLIESKAGQWKKPLYVDRKLKKKLYDRVAKGNPPLKMTTVDDYLPFVCQVFSDIDEKAVRLAIEHGFRSFYMINLTGNDVSIYNRRNYPYAVYCGKIYSDKEKMLKYWRRKYTHRVRAQYKLERTKKPWSGYYYFGLSEDDYKKYIPEKNGRIKQKICFPTLMIYKSKQEACMNAYIQYAFRTPWKEEGDWKIFLKDFETRNIELIGERGLNGMHYTD